MIEPAQHLRPTGLSRIVNGYRLVIAYLLRIWAYRYFWFSLVKLDLRTRYRRSWLGVGWSLMQPLALTAIFAVLFSHLFHLEPQDYAVYVVCGILVWNFLSSSILEGCDSITSAERYVRSYPLPLAIYPLRVALRVGFHFLLLLFATFLFTWCFRGFDNVRALPALLPACAILFVFAWSIGIVFGIANVFFPDVSHLSRIILQLAFYLTPVFYPVEMLKGRGIISSLLSYNVFTYFLNLLREPIMSARMPGASAYLVTGVTVTATALLAAVLLVKHERKLIFYLQ